MKKGFFITFEGGEGAGKSTQCQLLAEALTKKGESCLLTREPGGSTGAEEIRSLVVNGQANRWDSTTEMLLFMAARRDHLLKKIWPAINDGTIVICDRFLDSTLAYQGYGYGKDSKAIHHINTVYQIIAGDFKPDLTFILDIDPEEGIRRSRIRSGSQMSEQRFESMDLSFHYNLRQAFHELAQESNRYVIIDATRSIDEIHTDILKVIQERRVC